LQPTAIEDPTSLILLYKEAAINAKEAGFDGVEGAYLHLNPSVGLVT
jgi:2,4-dienoyl-CoA reductase-like NADH-dependent reductase (Old Yellow Enzyme family)